MTKGAGLAILTPIMFGLAACAELYYPEPINGMTIQVNVYDDPDELAAACGYEGDACAQVVGMVCQVHIPERAGYLWNHEVSHCFGRVDAPTFARAYK